MGKKATDILAGSQLYFCMCKYYFKRFIHKVMRVKISNETDEEKRKN